MRLIFIFILALLSQFAFAAEEEKKEKAFKPVAIPTISANRSKGTGLGVIGMGFFKMAKDEETPPSRVGFFANKTTKDNYNLVLFQQLFFKSDEWRLTSAQILANSNFQVYVDSPQVDSSLVVPYNNYFRLVFLSFQKRLTSGWFFGPLGSVGSADTTFDLPDGSEKKQVQQINSLGLNLTYDSTKKKYNSRDGKVMRLRWSDYAEWLGNDQEFGSFNLQGNWYVPYEEDVLATRFTAYYAYGDVPFVGERFVGNQDIRGYTQGEYRGDQVYTLQSEYRWNFKSLWGCVIFAGVAKVKDTEDKWSNLLPGGGTGLRYTLLKEEGINAGIDYAVGNADWGLYFRITEAF